MKIKPTQAIALIVVLVFVNVYFILKMDRLSNDHLIAYLLLVGCVICVPWIWITLPKRDGPDRDGLVMATIVPALVSNIIFDRLTAFADGGWYILGILFFAPPLLLFYSLITLIYRGKYLKLKIVLIVGLALALNIFMYLNRPTFAR